jgi:hypothetical protein
MTRALLTRLIFVGISAIVASYWFSPVLASDTANSPPTSGSSTSRMSDLTAKSPVIDVRTYGARGDGSDDTTAIQKALNASSSVYFPRGNYRISSPILINSGQHLYGDGSQSKIYTTTNYINLISAGSPSASISNVIIERLKFQGNNTNNGTENSGNGIILDHATDVTIKDCSFYNFGQVSLHGAGICLFRDCQRVTIDNNYITDGYGGFLGSDIVIAYTSGDVFVTNNRCYSTNSQGIFNDGGMGLGRVIISGNICKNHSRHGIIAYYGAENYRDIIVTNNICIDNGWSGIYVLGSWPTKGGGTVLIKGNIIDSCSGKGGDLNGGIVSDNRKPVLIEGNYIYNSGYTSRGNYRGPGVGIRLNNDNGTVVIGNVIDKCGTGIYCYNNISRICILNNYIIDNSYAGIYTLAGDNIVVDSAEIMNNVVKNVNVDGDGIKLNVSGSNFVISGNTIIGMKSATSKIGLYTVRGTFGGKISNNTLTNWDTAVYLTMAANFLGRSAIGYDLIEFNFNRIANSTVGLKHESYSTITGVGNIFSSNTADLSEDHSVGAVTKFKHGIPAASGKRAFYSPEAPNIINNSGETFYKGEMVINSDPDSGRASGWMCTSNGTFRDQKNTTGTSTEGSPIIKNIKNPNLFVNDFVTVDKGFPSSTTSYQIIAKGTGTITLNVNAISNQANITTACVHPVFKAISTLP